MDAKSIRPSAYPNPARIENQSELNLLDLLDDSDNLDKIQKYSATRAIFAGKCLDKGKYATLETIAKQYGSLKIMEMTDFRWSRLCEINYASNLSILGVLIWKNAA